MKKQIRLLVESLFDNEFDDIYDGDDIDMELSSKLGYNYYPDTFNELRDLLKQLLEKRGKDADLNDIDVSQIITFCDKNTGLFEGLDPHNIDISNWDVSNVENMRYMFQNCTNFNSDLSNWDVSNVTHMYSMFYYCEKFNSDLSNWNVSNVKDMSFMFWSCQTFNSNLNNWDVSNVEDMSYIFNGCKSLKIIPDWYKK